MAHFWFVALAWLFLSGVIQAAKTKEKFSFDSSSNRPSKFFATQVLSELERLHQSENNELCESNSNRLGELLRIFREEVGHTSTVISNYNLIKPPVDKLTYYLVKILEICLRFDGLSDSLENFVIEYLEKGPEEEVNYLLQALCSNGQFVPFLARISAYFIKEDFSVFKKMQTICPPLVNAPIFPKGSAQRLTPLAVAAMHSAVGAVEALIEAGADVNARIFEDPDYGEVPVFYTCYTDYTDAESVAEAFLSAPGFRKELCIDSHGLTPPFYAVERGLHSLNFFFACSSFDWSESLQDNTSLMDAFGFAIIKKHEYLAEMLRHLPDFDVGKTDEYGSTYLMLAAQFNRSKAIQLIYSMPGAKDLYQLQPGHCNLFGETALTMAIGFGAHKVLKELLKHTIEFEVNTENGSNPLARSIYHGDEKSVELILKHPAVSVDATFNFAIPGMTVYEYAQNFGTPKILQLLDEFKQKKEEKLLVDI